MGVCVDCGSNNLPGARFCNACGKRLDGPGDGIENAQPAIARSRRPIRLPKLKYLLPAVLLVGLGWALAWFGSSSPEFQSRAKGISDQLGAELEKLDVVNVAGIALKVGRAGTSCPGSSDFLCRI